MRQCVVCHGDAEMATRVIEAVGGRAVAFGTSDSGGDEPDEGGEGQLPGSSSGGEEDAAGDAAHRAQRGSSSEEGAFPRFTRRPRTKRPRQGAAPQQSALLDDDSPSEGGSRALPRCMRLHACWSCVTARMCSMHDSERLPVHMPTRSSPARVGELVVCMHARRVAPCVLSA